MKFKVKVKKPDGRELTEENSARNEEELLRIYKMLGYTEVQVLEKIEDPSILDGIENIPPELLNPNMPIGNMAHAKLLNQEELLPAPGIEPDPELAPAPKPKNEYFEYEDNGTKYRVNTTTHELEKWDCIPMESDELDLIMIKEGEKLVPAKKSMKLYKRTWVLLKK